MDMTLPCCQLRLPNKNCGKNQIFIMACTVHVSIAYLEWLVQFLAILENFGQPVHRLQYIKMITVA
jgi:hypothetical protein